MAAKNGSLHKAKVAQFDEFFTPLQYISQEVGNYAGKFQRKTVYCNCDNPFESNFCRFFLTHFDDLGLNRLICTSYGPGYVLDITEAAFSIRASDDEIYRFQIGRRLNGRRLNGRRLMYGRFQTEKKRS